MPKADWDTMWMRGPTTALLLNWRNTAALERDFVFSTCRNCRIGFWQERKRGRPGLYCTARCRQFARHRQKWAQMRQSRTWSGQPNYARMVVLDDRLVVRGPGGDWRARKARTQVGSPSGLSGR
jgi:hypothetical protein